MYLRDYYLKDYRRYLTPLLLALAAPVSAGAVELQGPPAIVRLLERYVPEEAAAPRRLQTMLGEILATEGYFSPVFETSGEGETLRLHIDPGPRTTIADVDLRITGPIEESTRSMLSAGWRLPVGQPFRQQDWSDAKQQVLAELLAAEHAGARLVESEAEIDAETQRARLHVQYDAGPRYRFGLLRVEGLHRFTPALIERYNRSVRPGKPYREDDLKSLQDALQNSPYFSNAQVSLDRDDAENAKYADTADNTFRTAPVRVDVRERPAHRLGFGAGVSSNTGARVEANYQTPDLFNQAWVLDGGLRIEQKKQTAYADVFLPPDEKNRRHGIGLAFETTDIEGLKTTRQALGFQSIQQRGSVEQRLSLNWQHERQKPDGALTTTNRALAPNALWIWRNVDDLFDPRNGTVLQAQIGGGTKALLSDQDFLRLHGRWQQYIPLGRLDTLALRAELGATLAPSRRGIPQDYLFRTGGTGSVRGYSYQSLGVEEGSAIVGGRYLGVVSVEATHWLNPSWGIAAFIDAGDAADTVRRLNPAVGYGFGVRWRSPAGPIGLDLAHGKRTGELHLHFALAIPF